MAQASVRASLEEEAVAFLSDEEEENIEISSVKSLPVTRVTSGKSSGQNGNKKDTTKFKKPRGSAKALDKPSSTPSSRATAKLNDLSKLEEKLSGQIEERFTSLDGKFERLFGLISSAKGTDLRQASNARVDNSTSGACRPRKDSTDTTGGRSVLMDSENSLDGFSDQDQDQDDLVSLQPGQRERNAIGLLSDSEDEVSLVESEHQTTSASRFEKYSNTVQIEEGKENGTLTHDMFREMFGDDAQANSSNSKNGLCLDKAQIDTINLSWRCKVPDKISAYKETCKQSFPVSDSTETVLKVPSLDDLSERLLIRKHGRKAAFGSTQSLFSQPYKSIEKIAFQGQVAARMGIISICYTQQALGSLLNNLKSTSPNLDEAIQNVRDIFAMSTKSLDQMSRTGAFHHLNRRKATIADTGLHEFKDLQKTAVNAPLSGEGIFGPEFEKNLKDRQEKDKQLSDLMPETNKKFSGKRKSSFQSDSSNQKKSRYQEDSYKPYHNKSSGFGSGYNSGYRRQSRGNSYSSQYRGNSRNSTVGSFRFQGNKNNKA